MIFFIELAKGGDFQVKLGNTIILSAIEPININEGMEVVTYLYVYIYTVHVN